MVGCHGPVPAVDPTGSISTALNVRDAIVFQIEGGPTDESFENAGTLTLSEAMRRAVTTDPAIQASLARVYIALADARQSRLLPNPILNLAIRWPRAGGTPIVEASLAQDLIAILMMPRKASAADHRLHAAAADAVTTALDVASELQERYATVQAFDELVPVLQQRRELLDRLADLAKARLDAGEGRRQDLTVLQAQCVELDVEIATTVQERRDERLRLARLIGEPSGAADWTLERWRSPDAVSTAESAWVEAALACRPEVQSQTWLLAALGDDMALLNLLPFEGASAGVSAEADDGWSVGPELATPIPLFDMGQARRDRASAEQIEARHELTRLKRMVVEDVRRAFESLQATKSNLERVRSDLIPLQQQRLSAAEATFRAERDITGLILAEQDLRDSQARAVELERQVTVALIRLHRAVGGPGVAESLSRNETFGGPMSVHAPPIEPLANSQDQSKEVR